MFLRNLAKAITVGTSLLGGGFYYTSLKKNVLKSSLASTEWDGFKTVYDFTVKSISNEDVSLEKYRGKVCIIVNVATAWGVTKVNYLQLQKLYEDYYDKGLRVLAFPCNQYAQQEPYPAEIVKREMHERFGCTFDMFKKIDVKGPNADPLFTFLVADTSSHHGVCNIKWNFNKFLIDKNGVLRHRFGSRVQPAEMEEDIIKLLKEWILYSRQCYVVCLLLFMIIFFETCKRWEKLES